MKRKNVLFFILITLMFAISYYGSLGVYSVPQSYRYRWRTYQISASNKDAYNLVNEYVDTTSDALYLKTVGHDVRTGLIFDSVDKLSNSTIVDARLELYTIDDSIENGQLLFSILGINQTGLTTFNGSEVQFNNFRMTLERDDFIASQVLSYSGEGWYNLTIRDTVRAIFRDSVFVNNTNMGLLTLGTQSVEYVTVRSYDYNASLAPRLHIRERYLVYDYSVPSDILGVNNNPDLWTFIRTYRGYDIWRLDIGTVSLGDWTEADPTSVLTVNNRGTNFTGITFKLPKDTYRVSGDYGVNYFANVTVDFEFRLTDSEQDGSHPTINLIAFNDYIGDRDYGEDNNGNGIAVCGTNWLTGANDKWLVGLSYMNSGASSSGSNTTIKLSVNTWYYLTFTRVGRVLRVVVYSDPARTTKVTAYQLTMGVIMKGKYFRYAYLPQLLGSDVAGTQKIFSGALRDIDIGIFRTAFYIDDPNNGLENGNFTTQGGAEDFIDQLVDVGTTHDRLPNLGNNIILMMGLLGLIMMPLGFVMLVLRFQTGDYADGAMLFMILFWIGLSFVITWLWG